MQAPFLQERLQPRAFGQGNSSRLKPLLQKQGRRRRGSGPGIEVQQRRRRELTGGVEAAAGGVPAQRLGLGQPGPVVDGRRSEEHTSELQSLMRSSYAVFCLKQNKQNAKQMIITHL